MHRKHAKLTRPNYGQFARNEWAIVGTSDEKIQQLAYALTEILSQEYKVAYVDTDHASAEESRNQDSAMAFGASMEYTDKITFHRFDIEAKLEAFQFRKYFNGQDLVLVNGNHFKAKKQIVVIDPEKEASLHKKLDNLTDVALILTTDETPIYTFLKDHIQDIEQIPILKLEQVNQIANFLRTEMEEAKPALFGLVLAGGKSQRMGQDKGAIQYHGKAQREYAADLLNQFCEKTFVSVRSSQLETLESAYPLLPDTFEGLGPFGAIVSAFREYPNHAWLVVACDLPLLDQASLEDLTNARNRSALATAFNSPVNDFPEPLIAIWEPRSYPVLLQYLAQGYSCPRKVLINSEVELIEAKQPEALMNVNYPEEVAKAKLKIKD